MKSLTIKQAENILKDCLDEIEEDMTSNFTAEDSLLVVKLQSRYERLKHT